MAPPVEFVQVAVPAGHGAAVGTHEVGFRGIVVPQGDDVGVDGGVRVGGRAESVQCVDGGLGGFAGDAVQESGLVEVTGEGAFGPGGNGFLRQRRLAVSGL